MTGSARDDRAPVFRIYVIILGSAAILATALRFWSRMLAQGHWHRFWWDDWTALAATFVLVGQLIITVIALSNGLGRHLWALRQDESILVGQLIFAIYFSYSIALTFSKASVLLLMSRIFPSYTKWDWFSLVIWITHSLNLAWLIGVLLGTLFICNPITRHWDPTGPGRCGSTDALYIGSAIPGVVIDLIILTLPLPKIWHIHASRSRRIAVTLVFVLGYWYVSALLAALLTIFSVIVASLGRLITILTSSYVLRTDITHDGLDIFYWTWAETSVAVIGISLPAILHLHQRLKLKLQTLHSVNTFPLGPWSRHGDSINLSG
ncbi:hypothetical protein B0I35DRAFT_114363 [Stachybotrys elegans]|uniref:Rhodopsin domain-containing protein n=1 Tax=Stachybotrys elegans TaxID=80388 RepID=A0A8K0SB10_9HYPO|nr:hypothetical protein B0I35DRAFT_114363 [Stachybotrys elegans]